MSANKYTILSIGPIYDSLMLADNTRAWWTVSFMFSQIMKDTIRHVLDQGHEADFLVPHISDEFRAYLQDGQRIGIFHDRLILAGDHLGTLQKAFNTAVANMATIIIDTFAAASKYKHVAIKYEPKEVRAFVRGFFQSYIAAVDVPTDKNPILKLSEYMDAVEHEPRLAPHEEKEYLFLFLRLTNLGMLQKIAFRDEAHRITQERCFKSLPEIAAWELIREESDAWKRSHLCLRIDDAQSLKERIKDPEAEDRAIMALLKERFPAGDAKDAKAFKPYHNYVAVVHADGDNFGDYLSAMKDPYKEKIHRFSDDVFAFLTQSRDAIRAYGGYHVIGSGEDLLFFAPVINGCENIFTLIDRIDTIFKGVFGDPTLSLSFGVSVTYYKYPLTEAKELSSSALWDHAKNAKWINAAAHPQECGPILQRKNTLHLSIRKHSGQSHHLTLPKDTLLYQLFRQLLDQELSPDPHVLLPHAFHHSIQRIDKLIEEVDPPRIRAVFGNFFDEDLHKTRHKEALEAVQKILKELRSSSGRATALCEKTSNTANADQTDNPPCREDEGRLPKEHSSVSVVFSMLSTIKLLRGDE